MNFNDRINLLVDFASQIDLSGHQYIIKSQEGFSLTKNKTSYQDLSDFIKTIISDQQLSGAGKREVYAALERIESHLSKKISGLFSFGISKKDKAKIESSVLEIKEFKKSLATKSPTLHTEQEARLKFYEELPKKLHVTSAATNDLEAIKVVSRKIWDRFENYEEYAKYMTLFFEGEHLLFEESDQKANDHFAIYDELRDSHTGAYLRGSSHYDHGTTNGKTGGPAPTQQEIEQGIVQNPQYEVAGPQVKALLFGRVKLAFDPDGNVIFGKTFDQAYMEAQTKKLYLPSQSKKYTFMQTEWAPDSESIFTANFWKHRIFSFGLYVSRKILGFSRPNVGPYGYGHADRGKNEASNPSVISSQK